MYLSPMDWRNGCAGGHLLEDGDGCFGVRGKLNERLSDMVLLFEVHFEFDFYVFV